MDLATDPLYVKGAAGLLGGAVALTLDPPKTRADLARRMFVAGVCGWAFPGPTMRQLNIPMVDPTTGKPDLDMILAVGLVWGIAGWFVLGLLMRTLTGWRDKGAGVLDAAREVKNTITGKDGQP